MIDLTKEAMELFARGGGQPSLTEWLALSSSARAHLADAGDKIRGELADMIVANTPVGAAARLMGEKPEEVADRIAMHGAADAAAGGFND